jgi:predicted peptidase
VKVEFSIIRALCDSMELQTARRILAFQLLTHEEPCCQPELPTGRFSAMITASMRSKCHRRSCSVLLAAILFVSTSCKKKEPPPQPDHPRLTPNVVLRDVTFRSAALNRDMQYRVVSPASENPARKLPVVFLLHGGGGGFRDWTNYSDVARFAESGLIFVMPEGAYSYYTNAVDPPQDRYEDYIVGDLISDVEKRFPAAADRSKRAIVGVSMGGFGAVKLALRHPDLFAFAGGISSAIDVPQRRFSIHRLQQSRHFDAIFGPSGSQHSSR